MPVSADLQKPGLIRGIGIVGGALLVLNGMVGSGIFALPPVVAANAGTLSPWLFLATSVLFMTVVLTFAALASFFRESGGPVLYATAAFGPLVGFSTGWMYYVSRVVALAANARILQIYLGAIWPWFHSDVGQIAVVTTIIGGLTIINVRGVKNGVRTLGVFSVLKIVPLLALILLGMQYFSAETLLPSGDDTIDELGGTVLLLLYAFIGFETVLITAGETANPRSTLPRTMILMVIATGVFYCLIMAVYNSVLPSSTDPDATLIDVGRVLAGPVGVIAVTLTAIFSISGSLSSMMLAGPRLTFALGENRLLPEWFSHVHARFSTPANSVLFMGGLAFLIAVSGSFVKLAIATSLARLLAFIVCTAALPVIRKRADADARAQSFHLRGGLVIPVCAFFLCLWVVSKSPPDAWLMVGGLLLSGLVPYFLTRRRYGRTELA